MVPQAVRRPLIALAVATAGLGLSGCAGIPGVSISPKVEVPPPAPVSTGEPSSEPSSEPSARPTRTSYSPRPTTTRPSSTTTRPASTRPPATPTGNDDEDEVGAGYVRKEAVQGQIATAVKDKTGQVAGVECPDNLPARVGATMTCKIVRLAGKDIQPKHVEVKVTGLEGRKVRFTMEITSQ